MKIQLALDRLTKDECFHVLKETEPYVDWIEVGTGVIKQYGMSIVREIKNAYPDKTIVADMKTCDAGRSEARQAFEAGADITTVMAFSAPKTISDCLDEAKKYRKRVMIDLLGIDDSEKVEELTDLGADLVSLHFGKDMQQDGKLPDDFFNLVSTTRHVEVAVAGGINPASLPAVVKHNPSIVIIGSAITRADNKKEAASNLKGMMHSS